MVKRTPRKQLRFDKNPIEAMRDSGISMAKSSADVLITEVNEDISTAWKQLLGVKESNRENTRSKQEEVIFSKKEEKVRVEPGMDYISEVLHFETKASNETHRELNIKIEQLRVEIAKLSKSSKQLEMVVQNVSIDNVSSNPGKYHLNFFEWVLATISAARIRVEESTNWLSTVSTKSSKRDYWSLAKKHGTSYMLSGERVVAQQTG